MPRALIVIGCGPGIGVHVASYFASQGFSKIALMARNQDQLKKDCETVKKARADATVKTYAVDVTDSAALRRVLADIKDDLGPPEAVFFNAARVRPSTLLEVEDEELLYDYKISTVALHQTAKWAIPQLIDLAKEDHSARPSLLVTSTHLPWDPEPSSFVLSIAKAAQRNLTESLAKVFHCEGVHFGLVTLAGMVTPKNTVLNPENVAKKTYELYAQEQGSWALETYMREPGPWRGMVLPDSK
ncbi:hypothetical protein E4U43_000595 [Claviceps pusilla]|uniref:NAD(P)-binding protein n=1 Tax=Claviceps pusilla TaxID=123648 RepID=A0A9P7SXJ4_9HYPO|nr:hypothetical protein E4U43_000595 [Claviceps pusilla]